MRRRQVSGWLLNEKRSCFVDMTESVDELEDTTVLLKERIWSLEEENSLLRTRLDVLEIAMQGDFCYFLMRLCQTRRDRIY